MIAPFQKTCDLMFRLEPAFTKLVLHLLIRRELPALHGVWLAAVSPYLWGCKNEEACAMLPAGERIHGVSRGPVAPGL